MHEENINLKTMPPSNFLKSSAKEDSGEIANGKD